MQLRKPWVAADRAKRPPTRAWGGMAAAVSFLVMTLAAVVVAAPASAQQTRTLKMQSTWTASMTIQDNFRFLAERVDKLTGGALKIEVHAAGQIVPPFEILDATHKKVIDGGHGISYYWVGKNKAATLFSNTPAGIVGMDHLDFLGWVYEGGGLDLWWEFYQKELKLNVVAFPVLPASPQALGWFKRPIQSVEDFKGMKCRQTGIVSELYKRMGQNTVNMPGGEIVPAAERGTIDCAEWVGGAEDLTLGLPQVFKYHYAPGMHESASIGELLINKEVWDSLPAQQQEAIRSAGTESFVRWWAKWQKQNAEALEVMQAKYGVQILNPPRELHLELLKAWDDMAKEESAANPFFKKVYESQKAYAAKVVPARRFMFPPYSFLANYYFPPATK
jgi:TRAP-type mannitol/chloroaromatic compound transport system substrate-binding protein